jgi:hypothetical protein
MSQVVWTDRWSKDSVSIEIPTINTSVGRDPRGATPGIGFVSRAVALVLSAADLINPY